MENQTTVTKWVIDASHSEIGFKVKHLMFTNVRGWFKDFGASITTTNDDFKSAEIDFWLNSASITTGDAQRDGHLMSADFFDAEHYQQIKFKATSYENARGDGKYELNGDLTIKDVTKQIKLDVEYGGIVKDPWGNPKAVFSINGKINRKDWGLNWNAALETGGVLVSEDVWINCEVQLSKQA